MQKKKILICGAGSVGIYLGTLLFAQGNNVTLLGKRKLTHLGSAIFINNTIYSLPKKVFSFQKNRTYDFIFITTKLYDLEAMIKAILKNKVKTKILVSIQNGLVDNSVFERVLKGQELIILSVFEGFRLFENQLVMTPTDMGWKVEETHEGKQISKLLSATGINCSTEKKLNAFRAEKTIVNCTLNALSAIEKKPFDKLFATPRIRKRIDKLFNECYTILKQEHTLEEPSIIKKRMYQTWSKMNHYSSTCQDALSGRKTEIDFLNGYMVKFGKKYNLSTTENERIITQFKRIHPPVTNKL